MYCTHVLQSSQSNYDCFLFYTDKYVSQTETTEGKGEGQKKKSKRQRAVMNIKVGSAW